MQIYLISVGNRMPAWVKQGYEEYAKRMPKDCQLILKEIAPGKRLKNTDVTRVQQMEGDKMLAAIPADALTITLDLGGQPWSTSELAAELNVWRHSGQSVALLIGGPEGLADSVRTIAGKSWCLSNLTFPHPLVRIIVAEQLYRAWSILSNHPYHR